MRSGILTGLTFLFGAMLILFGAVLISSSWQQINPIRGTDMRWSIELLVIGSLVMGLGVLQLVLSGRRRKRKLAEVRSAEGVVAAFREPAPRRRGSLDRR